MKHFLWQLLSWYIAVKKKLRARGLQGGTIYAQCGVPGESINHVFLNAYRRFKFERSHEFHWIHTSFPLNHLQMDHLFWRVSPELKDHQSAWILLYIWKCETTKSLAIWILILEILSNWQKQVIYLGWGTNFSLTQGINQSWLPVEAIVPSIPGRCCFTDGSWKK